MKIFFLMLMLLGSKACFAQNDRLNDYNNTNWIQFFGTVKLDKKWSLHAEYQWRRESGLKNWQQSLLRIGVNRKLNENITAHVGYGWIETFSYGNFPLANNGTFPEHRIYEQLSFKQLLNKFTFTHRFRVEQRWLGKVIVNRNREIEAWTYLNRFRYQFKIQYNFTSKLYVAATDEIFIGAGKNVGTNIFDQNRIFLLIGFKLSGNISFEAGYFNQTLQQGKRINNNTILQRNNGIVLSNFINL